MAEFNAYMKEFLRLCDEIGNKNYTISEMAQYRQYVQVYVTNAKQRATDIHFADFDQIYDKNTRAINNGPEVTQWLSMGPIFLHNVSRNVKINLTWFYNQAVEKAQQAQTFISSLVETMREEETAKHPELKWADTFLLHLYQLFHESSSSANEKKTFKGHIVTIQRKLGMQVDEEADGGIIGNVLDQFKSFGLELPEGVDVKDMKGMKGLLTGWLRQPDTRKMIEEGAKAHGITFEEDPTQIVDKVLGSFQKFGKTEKGKKVFDQALNIAEKNLPSNLVEGIKAGAEGFLDENEGTSGVYDE
jgi:hypothetical protein